ncbi:hypothetical protein IQ274_30055 [Nostoc sp. LEGE 12447]|nr:hypothetical protein [Nostoc sp. LEGE 12447]
MRLFKPTHTGETQLLKQNHPYWRTLTLLSNARAIAYACTRLLIGAMPLCERLDFGTIEVFLQPVFRLG